MKRSRFSEEQIIEILKDAEGESCVKVVCAKHNISEATYYAWKKKYGGMDVAEARRLRALQEENGRLKRLVADQAVQIQILKEVNSKNGKPVSQETGGRNEQGGKPWQHRASRPGIGTGEEQLQVVYFSRVARDHLPRRGQTPRKFRGQDFSHFHLVA
jgi:putative transposase